MSAMKILPSLLIASLVMSAQNADQGEREYIPQTFLDRIGELPDMGWFDPTRGFLARRGAAETFIYGAAGAPERGLRVREITGKEILEIRQDGTACEIEPEDRLTAFAVGEVAKASRALFTTKKMPGDISSGLVMVPLTQNQLTQVNRALGWPQQGTLRRDRAFAARTRSLFYSIHRLYSSKTRLLQQEAIVLHRSNGQIIAFDLARGIDTEPFCADCENPSYEDADAALFRPLNVFEMAAFPFPLVLLDTNTIEGQALSLRTFTPEGKAAQYRIYEYVVNCR